MKTSDTLPLGAGISTSTTRQAQTRDLLILGAVAASLFFISLGARDLWNPNEPIYGRAVTEMTQANDWLVPTINGNVFAEKPILYYWGALLASKVFGGVNEFSLRVPSAVAGVASALLTYLLVLPYAGRRQALLTGFIFLTLYQVFWASRAVQMDVLVMTSTLGVLVPLTRLFDFGAKPKQMWALAGLAAGLGFTAKGPVTLVVPGVAIVGYALISGNYRKLFTRYTPIGVVAAILVALPWYLALYFSGPEGFLYEVLIRQNFHRFVDAWDHIKPWWYFLQYLIIDYSPWSFLLPAAVLLTPTDNGQKKLRQLAVAWIGTVVFFFSLSESKRAPYILPVAPAIAVLASSVVDRLFFGGSLERASRNAVQVAMGIWAFLLSAAGLILLFPSLVPKLEVPAEIWLASKILGAVILIGGLTVTVGVVTARRRPAIAPAALLITTFAAYFAMSVLAQPAANSFRSARVFAINMNRHLDSSGGSLVSYQFWDWRSGYSYYANRSILNHNETEEVVDFWRNTETPYILVETPNDETIRGLFPEAVVVESAKIGSRTAMLFARNLNQTPVPSPEG